MLKSRKQLMISHRRRLPNAWQGPLQWQQVLRPGKGGANIFLSETSIWTRKLKNQIYDCPCLQGVQRPRKRDFEKCMGRVRKTPLSRVSVKTSNNQIKVTTGITNMNIRLTWELRYNSSLFAYGQTGSGKSWSVFGYGINKGIFAQASLGKYMIRFVKWCHGQYPF